jgi:hypothetical protein
MKPRLIASVAVFSAILSGCASVSEVVPVSKALPDGYGVVVLYRPSSFVGIASCPSHAIDGKNFRPLSNDSQIRFEVPAGVHVVTTQTSWCFAYPLEVQVQVASGRVSYVRFTRTGAYRQGFFRGSQIDSPWTGLEVVPSEQAQLELTSK